MIVLFPAECFCVCSSLGEKRLEDVLWSAERNGALLTEGQ